VTGGHEQGVRFETLGPQHDRAGFDCGVPALDRYLAQQATQDVRRRVANCFVAAEGARVLGYYTLAATSIALTSLPETVSKKLPRYPTVPAALIGRLAVAQAARGQGLGGAMLMETPPRAFSRWTPPSTRFSSMPRTKRPTRSIATTAFSA